MASQYGTERDRGAKESWQQIEVLREKWPLAFPVKPHDIRPLAIAAGEIAVAMGWSLPLRARRPLPLEKLLHNERIALDGSPAEAVDRRRQQRPDHHVEKATPIFGRGRRA
jgi:hypothetical protein